MFERYTEKARRAIFFARYEASQFGSPYIETEHILLGLLRENRELVRLLPQGSEKSIQNQIEAHAIIREKVSTSVDLPLSNESKRVLAYGAEEAERLAHRHMVEIRGIAWNVGTISERLRILRRSNWYWQQREWKARDLAVGEDGKLSFDVSLVQEGKKFELCPAGWKSDQCAVCEWALFESEDQPEHGICYTNGRDWVCTECYDKFLSGPDFFATAHPEITRIRQPRVLLIRSCVVVRRRGALALIPIFCLDKFAGQAQNSGDLPPVATL